VRWLAVGFWGSITVIDGLDAADAGDHAAL
jgi:hypothetical protein